MPPTQDDTPDFRDYYAVLGVAPTAHPDEIKEAYRKLIKGNHPDHSDDPNAEEITKQLNEAHSILSNAGKREAYDREYRQFQRDQEEASQPRLFEKAITLSLQDAYYGVERTVELDDGEYIIDIPPGVDTGDEVEFAILNDTLKVIITVESGGRIKREGLNLLFDHPVNLFTAVLGGESIISFFDEELIIQVPAGTSSERPIRIRDKGMTNWREPNAVGDVYVRLLIRTPTELSDEQRSKFEELAALFRENT